MNTVNLTLALAAILILMTGVPSCSSADLIEGKDSQVTPGTAGVIRDGEWVEVD